jgi:hypothetical protein
VPLNGRAPTATARIFLRAHERDSPRKKREDYQIDHGAGDDSHGQTGVAAGTFTANSHLVGNPTVP